MVKLKSMREVKYQVIIGIDHDAVCTGVVCAATPALHECCTGVEAQTTATQTVWVVNFYSTTKPKQSTAIDAATMNRHAENLLD